MKKIIFVYLITLIIAFFSPPLLAHEEEKEKKEEPWEKFTLNLGWFFTDLESSVRFGLKGVGIEIDVEEALGFDTKTSVFRVDSFWRFSRNRRHRADFSWFALRRDGTKTLGRDIEIGDTTFPLGSTVKSSLDIDIFKGGYSYSFLQDDRIDMAAGLGLFVMPISFEISASGVFEGQESESITAPLPVLGLRADLAITPKVFLKSSFEILYLEIATFKGSILDVKISLEYNPFKYVGFGIGFESFRAGVEADKEDYPEVDFRGKIEFEYSGIQLFGKFHF
jgi:hypothetical protein